MGEDDDVFEWDEQQLAHDQPHALKRFLRSKYRKDSYCVSGPVEAFSAA
jgi:hypothetical protein